MKFEIKILEREKYLKTTYLRDVPFEDIEGKYYEYRKPDNNLNITLHNRVFVVDVDKKNVAVVRVTKENKAVNSSKYQWIADQLSLRGTANNVLLDCSDYKRELDKLRAQTGDIKAVVNIVLSETSKPLYPNSYFTIGVYRAGPVSWNTTITQMKAGSEPKLLAVVSSDHAMTEDDLMRVLSECGIMSDIPKKGTKWVIQGRTINMR
jgi:hypothetical protein